MGELAERDQVLGGFVDGLVLVGARAGEIGHSHGIDDAAGIGGIDALLHHAFGRLRGLVVLHLDLGTAGILGREARFGIAELPPAVVRGDGRTREKKTAAAPK